MTRWRTFWDELTACGRSGWPQLLRLPQSLLGPGPTYNLVDLRRRLAELGQNDGEGDGRYDLTQRSFDDLVTLTPDGQGDGSFVITPDLEGEISDARTSPDMEGDDDHRQVTFLDARAIAL